MPQATMARLLVLALCVGRRRKLAAKASPSDEESPNDAAMATKVQVVPSTMREPTVVQAPSFSAEL